jgi:serine/threonine protein kinase
VNSQEKVFNGVFYNLDAQLDSKYTYEDESELYTFYEKIGEGAFSTVHRALFKPTGEIIAVKILRPERCTPKVIESVKTEAIILSKLDHPNIIKVRHLI